MRLSKRMRIALVVLVPVLAFLAYELGVVYGYGNYHYRAAGQALDQRDFLGASAHLEKCFDVAPDNLSARLLAAQAARRRGDFEEANRQLHFIQRNKGPAEAVEAERRLMLAEQGDLREAQLLLAYCLEHPDAPETPLALESAIQGSLLALAEAFTESMTFGGGFAESFVLKVEKGADLWLQLRPGRADQVEGLLWHARACAMANDQLKAKEDVRKALELDPDHYDARFHMAMYLMQEAPTEAVEHFRRLAERHPEDRRVRFGLGSVLHSIGQLAEARQVLDGLLVANPRDVQVLIERGRVALDERQPIEAERFLRRALTESPNVPEVNLALCTCLKLQGRGEEAEDYQKRFLELETEQRQRRQQELIRKSQSVQEK
jgi:Tfp pilus assembly protein PilF